MYYRKLERIAELFGVADFDIPAFITAVEEAIGSPVEDWHGKVSSDLA